MATWFERRPGSEETLLALYDAVQTAEELDLEEQAHDEAISTEIGVLHGLRSDEVGETDEPADVVDSPDPENGDAGDRVSMSEAVGIIEHLLGGRPVPGSGQSAS